MAETPDWEAINLPLFTDLNPGRKHRVTFQTAQSKALDETSPVILTGEFERAYKDATNQWWIDVKIDETTLVADREMRNRSIGRMFTAAAQNQELPPLEGILEESLDPAVRSFLLADVVAPVITHLPDES